ncbi:hypothetical protein ACIRLA_40930 [Streptomyces sp. NPDC102364]|uniref:hypothetical protein n=1 Tax=Streptomyces sp. NPDC102364 TaxID=3366161 RepID=UPI003819141B
MNGPDPAPDRDVPAQPGVLLPLLSADSEAVAFFAGVADLDATDPTAHELEEGVRLASGARLEQFARAGSGDAFCFVGEGGEERPVVYISLDGEAELIALGLPELVRLCLVVPWWRDAPGRSTEELWALIGEYLDDMPDLDRRRDRAARALGLDPVALPNQAEVLNRLLLDLPREPIADSCLVVDDQGVPLDPLFCDARDRT